MKIKEISLVFDGEICGNSMQFLFCHHLSCQTEPEVKLLVPDNHSLSCSNSENEAEDEVEDFDPGVNHLFKEDEANSTSKDQD